MPHLTSTQLCTYETAPRSRLLPPPSSQQRGRETRAASRPRERGLYRASARFEGLSPLSWLSCVPSPKEIPRRSPPGSRTQSHAPSRADNTSVGPPTSQTANRGRNRPARASANRSAIGPAHARQNPGANRDPRGPPNHPPNRSRNGSQGDSRGVVSNHLQADGSDNVL